MGDAKILALIFILCQVAGTWVLVLLFFIINKNIIYVCVCVYIYIYIYRQFLKIKFDGKKQTLGEWIMVARGGRMGEEIVRGFEIDMYTLLYLKWITNKDLLYSTGNSTQCYVAAWWEGNLGENGYMYIYGWVPLLFIWNYHNIVNQLYSNIT